MSCKAKASAFITLRNAYFSISELKSEKLVFINQNKTCTVSKNKKKGLQLEVVHYHCFLCLDKKPQKFRMSNAKIIQLQKK